MMDKRAAFRFMNNQKLETYADMAGMTIYRDLETNKITRLSYEDYSFGDPKAAWERRKELFRPDPTEKRLPDQTSDRYCMDYWKRVGGPHRYSAAHYKTQEDIDNEIAEKEEKAKSKEGRAPLKEEAKEAERLKRRLELIKRDQERREQKAREATKRRVAGKDEKARIKAVEWKRQNPNYGPPPSPPRREADPFAFDRQWKSEETVARRSPPPPPRTEQDAIDGQYRETIARRMRQKAAMDSGARFSTPQQPGSAGVITWSDPLVTDVRLVRLVLGADRGSREMTAEEESDYWYWKARGK